MTKQEVFGSTFKLIAGVAALFLLFFALVPESAHASDGEQYTVKVDTGFLALRSEPAFDDDNVIGKLYTGDFVTVEEEDDGDYWWVYAPELGKSGYVNRDYLVTVVSYGDYTVQVSKGYLALRSAPAYDDGNVIGELYSGDTVTVKEMTNGEYWWVYTPKYDKCGYVNKDYLTTAPSFYGDYTVQVAKGYLALRSAPAFDDDNVIGELYTGDTVMVEEKRGSNYWWVYSPKHNREGYVDSDYLVKR